MEERALPSENETVKMEDDSKHGTRSELVERVGSKVRASLQIVTREAQNKRRFPVERPNSRILSRRGKERERGNVIYS